MAWLLAVFINFEIRRLKYRVIDVISVKFNVATKFADKMCHKNTNGMGC